RESSPGRIPGYLAGSYIGTYIAREANNKADRLSTMQMDPPSLPGQLTNLVIAVHRNLRPAMCKPFLEALEKQIEPWPGMYQVALAEGQISNDATGIEGVNYIGYLDPLWRFFALALLVDPEIGVLPHAKSPADGKAVIGLAKLLQRSIRGDFPSDEEW